MTGTSKDPEKNEEGAAFDTTRRLVSASHLPYFIPLAVIIGALVGRWVGGKFGHAGAGTLIGLAWGFATAIWEVIKVQKGISGGSKP